MEDTKETVFNPQQDRHTYEHLEAVEACLGLLQVQTRQGPRIEMGTWTSSHIPNQEASSTYNHSE